MAEIGIIGWGVVGQAVGKGFEKEEGVDASLLKTVWEKNKKIRKVKDWEEIEGAVNHKNKKD